MRQVLSKVRGWSLRFSCRHQFANFCDNRRSLDKAELLGDGGVNICRIDVMLEQ